MDVSIDASMRDRESDRLFSKVPESKEAEEGKRLCVPPPLESGTVFVPITEPPSEQRAKLRAKRAEIQAAQHRIMCSSTERFVTYLKSKYRIDVSKELEQFWEVQNEEITRLGLKQILSFGKYKGKSYEELWKEEKGRSYLQWLYTQEWCYEDVKRSIDALKLYYPCNDDKNGNANDNNDNDNDNDNKDNDDNKTKKTSKRRKYTSKRNRK